MSGSIKLKHASGNGVIIAAPSSNPAADRTLTLPSDADGVIAKTDSSGNLTVAGDLTVDTDTLKVDSSNNRVGIGTTSPAGKFHINLGTDKNIVYSGGIGEIGSVAGFQTINDAGSANTSFGIRATDIRLATGSAERMRVNSDGNVLIGTTSNDGDGLSIRPRQANGTTRVNFNRADTSDTGTALQFLNNSTTVGTIKYTNSATQYNTSSDYRLKENATAISDGIARLKTLKPYRFNFKVKPDTTVDGFFAHEVTAVPEAITGTKDEVVTQELIDSGEYEKGTLNNPIYQGIDQSKLVPLLVAALQEAVTKIETLETKVAALEAK